MCVESAHLWLQFCDGGYYNKYLFILLSTALCFDIVVLEALAFICKSGWTVLCLIFKLHVLGGAVVLLSPAWGSILSSPKIKINWDVAQIGVTGCEKEA